MDSFILHALIGGLCLALMTSSLGVFVVWRRMSYFGDSLAHSALLGVAIGLFLGISSILAVTFLAVIIVFFLMSLQKKKVLPNDTILGIFSHISLSLGLVLLSFMEAPNIDLMSYLFGDILTLTDQDLLILGTMTLVVFVILYRIWRSLLLITVNVEMAQVEGIAVERVQVTFSLLLALVIAIGIKVVGILLITSLLVIPPATARRFAKSPEQMVLFSILISCISVIGGISISLWQDTPTGPSIVIAAAFAFVMTWSWPTTDTA